MASTLKQLRSAAGFRTAADFAQSIDMSEHTYARYESNPSKIPLEKAWMLADRFGCSIDAIVDREQIEVRDARGEVQRSFDNLSPDSKIALEKYLSFLVQSDAHERVKNVERLRRRYEELVRRYEVLFYAKLEEELDTDKFLELGDSAAMREDFLSFVKFRLEEKQSEDSAIEDNPRDGRNLKWIMRAYDRIHGIGKSGLDYTYSTSPDLGDRLFISFDSGDRAKKGGEA